MSDPGTPTGEVEEPRQRYLIGVTTEEPANRDLFSALFPDQASLDAAGWRDALGALDDESGVAVGQPAVYSVELTAEQVRTIAESDVENLRWLELAPPALRAPTPILLSPQELAAGLPEGVEARPLPIGEGGTTPGDSP